MINTVTTNHIRKKHGNAPGSTTDFPGACSGILSPVCAFTILMITLTSCTQTHEKPAVTEPTDQIINNISISDSDLEFYQKGIDALKNQHYSKAQRIFTRFTRDKPDLAGAYSNLALIHYKDEEYDKSLELINKALQLNPEQAQAYQLRGLISVRKGKIHDAKSDYTRALELKPDYANAQYNLALLYDIYLQEIAMAIKHYEAYLSLIDGPDETTQEWVDQLKRALKNG